MLTRRTLLASAAAAPLLPRAVRADTPRDVLVMAKQIDDIISLDPQESFEFSGNEISANCYEKLIVADPDDDNRIKGALAAGWEVGEDGLTYTFHLRQDATFASGAPVTAEDAAFSLQRAVLMDKAPAFIINQFGFSKENAADWIKATDPHTLVLRIREKQAPTFLLYCFTANVASVVEKKAALAHAQNDDLGNAWLKTNSAGSGAWIVRSWRASESVALDANPAHPRAPALKRLIIRHVADPSAQLLLLQKGDVDIARNLASEQLRTVAGDPALATVSATKGSLLSVSMNTRHPALAKPEVRQAIKWAIDYDAIQKNIVPTTQKVHQTFLPEGIPAALNENPFRKDSAKARAMLAGAGFPDGFEIAMDHPSGPPLGDIAQAIQADLGEAGIKVSLLAGEMRQVITKVRARQHQLAIGRWGSDYFDPHSNAENFCINPDNSDGAVKRTSAWRCAWQDRDISDRALAASKETDGERRVGMYEQLQRDVLARGPYAIMLQDVEVAATRKGVSGFQPGLFSDRTVYAKIRKA